MNDKVQKIRKIIRKASDENKEIVEKKATPYIPLDVTNMVSTGSTLLDLGISGGRVRGGGIPGGIMVEIFGPNSAGKTALMVEMGASIQHKGGQVDVNDPEARLDKRYAEVYGLELNKDRYNRPNTVKELFDCIDNWEPENPKVLNMMATDSIAALSTDMELSADGDKRGQKKAKELHAGCRKSARKIAEENKLLVFTNQQLDGDYGATTSGGKSVGFYSSLRIQVIKKKPVEKEKVYKPEGAKGSGKKIKKVTGIYSEAKIIKSSIDDSFRIVPIYIMYGIGIDDIRANLQYVKDMTKGTMYDCFDGKTYQILDQAIKYIEDNDLEPRLRETVIDMWEEIESKFKVTRKKKVRF